MSSTGAAALLIALVNEIMGNQGQSGASVVWRGGLGSALCRVTTSLGGRLGVCPPGAGTATAAWPAAVGQQPGVQGGEGGLSIPGWPWGASRDGCRDARMQWTSQGAMASSLVEPQGAPTPGQQGPTPPEDAAALLGRSNGIR